MTNITPTAKIKRAVVSFIILSDLTISVFILFVNITNMNKLDIAKLKHVFSVLANEKRLKIVELCSDKEYTITELGKMLKLNYSITVEYTSALAKANLVEKVRNKDKTVSVKSLIRLNNDGEIKRIA